MASGYGTIVGGGLLNTADGHYSAVESGFVAADIYFCCKHKFWHLVVGFCFCLPLSDAFAGMILRRALNFRYSNKAFGYGSVVSGGHYNKVGSVLDDVVLNVTFATGAYAFVGAGWSNSAGGHFTSVVAGHSNTAGGSYSNIAGGYANSAHGYAASIGGGHINTAGSAGEVAGNYATIGGGWGNQAFGHFTVVDGGHSNDATGFATAVGGGLANTAKGHYRYLHLIFYLHLFQFCFYYSKHKPTS